MEANVFSSPSKAAQKILDLVPDLVVLDELNFTKLCVDGAVTHRFHHTLLRE